jgi:hypothetical protein
MSTALSPDQPELDKNMRNQHARRLGAQEDSSPISPYRTRARCFAHSQNWRAGIRWWSTSDFAEVARAVGKSTRRVERPAEVESAVQWAMAEPGPVLVDVVTSADEVAVHRSQR